ncbi:MAG: extracellular solute-binding protein [Anaerolineae bacterium]|nr:extracellular solute-binding protein [Anaerolineae bacterium]
MLLLALLIGVIAVPAATAIQAQSGITLTVALPDIMRMLLPKDVFAQFEAENPGVKVNIVYTGFDAQAIPPAANGLTENLEAIAKYVAKADVIQIASNTLSIEATRAGYLLNLAPLASADASLNVEDFLSGAWQSFQWDNSVWGLPVSTDAILVIYDPAAFDNAGLAYPNEAWTMDDFANAAQKLAQVDSSGKVTSAGMITYGNEVYLLRALAKQGFYDPNAVPDAPSFDSPQLEALLTTWAELQKDGYISANGSGEISAVPLKIFGSFGISAGIGFMAVGGSDGSSGNDSNAPTPPPVPESAGSLLPGGVAGLTTQGVAVSAGTQYPELAYKLAKYITNNASIANGLFGASPARRSLRGVQSTPAEGGMVVASRAPLSPEDQAFIDNALEKGFPVAELRYADYIVAALKAMIDDGTDAHTALQDAEAQAVTNLQTAADQKSTTVVTVATPIPEVVLQPGEIALNFGLQSFIQPMPNQEQWDQVIADFVASDPQVGKINLDSGFGDFAAYAGKYDCFYMGYNAVPNLDESLVLNLDPYLDADPGFDRSDVVGNALALAQKNNHTWALPIDIKPEVMKYNSELFQQAGVAAPENGWTIDQFVDALRALKPTADDATPFVPRGAGGVYLLQLIAAYGGLPLDYRTSPVTINFTDPATVEAIRQVLDLAKDGYIDYQELARGNFTVIMNGPTQDPIYTESLTGFNVREVIGGNPGADPYRITTYPRGSQYNTLSYDMGTAYISATTQNADACYRWLSTIARHPELFSAMPARRSLINDPPFAASQGADTAAIYKLVDALMSDPNTINFQSPFANGSDPSNFILEFWLNRAFDNYVLKDADLETELTTAQDFATAYQGCIANVAPFDATSQDRSAYLKQFTDCATTIDPSLTAMGMFVTQ